MLTDIGTNGRDRIDRRPVHKSVVVQGNHESKHIRWLAAERRAGPNLMKHVEDFAKTKVCSAHFDLIGPMPLWHQFWSGGRPFVVTHGGFPPNLEILPSQEELQRLSNKKQKRYAQVMRTRYITKEGHPAKLSEEKPTDTYWAELYDGRFGHCFFGHQVFHQPSPRKYSHCTAIDLGCVHGGYLCAAIVEDGVATYKTIQAHKEYTPYMHWGKQRPV
jgi:hypothetical protein